MQENKLVVTGRCYKELCLATLLAQHNKIVPVDVINAKSSEEGYLVLLKILTLGK